MQGLRIKIQGNSLIPEYVKMCGTRMDLGRADEIKVETIPAGIQEREGHEAILRGQRIKEQVKNEELERAKLTEGQKLFWKWFGW